MLPVITSWRGLVVSLLLLLPGLAGAQVTLTGTVRDSLTHEPLAFASVFLANTTLGTTTTAQGQFTLPGVPAGHYELVASYVGYRLARRKLAVEAAAPPPPLLLEPAPAPSQLAEVVVQGRRRANRPADYRRFTELFLGRTSFSRQCHIRNPQAIAVTYDAKGKVLTASATTFVEVENQALGYRLKYYGMHFTANFVRQVVTFYGQPVFEELPPRSERQHRRWLENRVAAYYGSLTHFLKSVYDNRVAAEGFVAQRLRIVPDSRFATADSLRRHLLHPAAYTAPERDSLARWAKVPRTLLVLYTAPLPIDSLRRVAADGRVFLRFTGDIQVSYLREPPDPLYGGTTASNGLRPDPNRPVQLSRLTLLAPEAELQANGQLANALGVFVEYYWSFEKVGEFLPLDYVPPPPTP